MDQTQEAQMAPPKPRSGTPSMRGLLERGGTRIAVLGLGLVLGAATGCSLFESDFDGGPQGFAYADDVFFGTSHPAYAEGVWEADGGFAGGGLVLRLGGVDGTVVVGGISGGFTRSFELNEPAVVRVSFRYRMIFPDAYESVECSQVLVAVDGRVYGPGLRDPLLEYCGGVPTQDSGWVDVSFDVPLSAGTHEMTLGGWSARKNQLEEITTISFDDVVVKPLGETVLFQEAFEAPGLPGWTVVDQSGHASLWSVSNGLLLQDDARVEQLLTSYYLGSYVHANTGADWDDYRLRVALEGPAEDLDASSPDTVGLLFRYQGPDDYYRLILSRKLGLRRLEKRVGGVFSTLAFDARGYVPGRGQDVTVTVRGETIVVSIDGARVFAVEDADLATGTVALYTEGRASFEHVVVSQPAGAADIALSAPASFSLAVPQSAAEPDRLEAVAQVNDAPGAQVRFLLDPGTSSEQEILIGSPPWEAAFTGVAPGDHVVQALLEHDEDVWNADERVVVGVGGHKLVGFGDSITEGVGDAIPGASQDGRNLGRGYHPFLNDALSGATGRPSVVYNEGVGGQRADQGAARVGETLLRHPDAEYWLVLFGTNDSREPPEPSGIGCSEADLAAELPGCVDTYKAHMRSIVLALQGADAVPVLGKVPYVLGASPTRDAAIQEYNQVIDQLVAEHGLAVPPPDFYTHVLMNPSDMADALHPNHQGYEAMADLWRDALVASGLLAGP